MTSLSLWIFSTAPPLCLLSFRLLHNQDREAFARLPFHWLAHLQTSADITHQWYQLLYPSDVTCTIMTSHGVWMKKKRRIWRYLPLPLQYKPLEVKKTVSIRTIFQPNKWVMLRCFPFKAGTQIICLRSLFLLSLWRAEAEISHVTINLHLQWFWL